MALASRGQRKAKLDPPQNDKSQQIDARGRVDDEPLFRSRRVGWRTARRSSVKLRILLSVGSVALVVAFGAYQIYMAQLNNAIALQRCVLEIERERRFTGRLPRSVDCVDHWGAPIAYVVRDGTYVLVSAGADGRLEANYAALEPTDIPSASTCLTRSADTVFVGGHAVRYCLK